MTSNESAASGLSDDKIDQLRELRQLNIDSAKGFEECCGLVDDDALKALFREIAHERREQAQVLATQIEWTESAEVESGSYLGALHRTWINLREACTTDNLEVALVEAARGEAVICEAYDDAAETMQGSPLGAVVARHRDVVREAVAQVAQLQQMKASLRTDGPQTI